MCDVRLFSEELKSFGGTWPYPCGFRLSAVEAETLKTKRCIHSEEHGTTERRNELGHDTQTSPRSTSHENVKYLHPYHVTQLFLDIVH